MHCPVAQEAETEPISALHLVPHLPQFCWESSVSQVPSLLQSILHKAVHVLARHTALRRGSLVEQALPQAPQWFMLVVTSTHWPLQ